MSFLKAVYIPVKGVILNVSSKDEVSKNFDALMHIKGATGVLVQPMLTGLELFVGIKKENIAVDVRILIEK